MNKDIAPLFAPLQVKHKTLRNRIVCPPMVVNRGLTTPEACVWYGERAAGGVSLAIVEASDSFRFGTEFTGENLRPLADAIHAGGALAAIQLFPFRRGQTTAPADLAPEDIQRLLAQYRLATEICAAAGFDGIEPHGAHGFLLNQFFSPVRNQRTDEYGGSLANRMRLACQIVETIRPIADRAGMLVLYRHTPQRDDFGYGIPDSLRLAAALVKAGVDILDLSPSSGIAPGDRAAPFMQLGVPVIAVNELNLLPRALEVLNHGRADLVAVGRGLIADPQWPIKVRDGREDEIVQCVCCDECFADLRRGVAVRCAEWRAGA
jgi:2,4-dienoyl-CoA reductase-like NADH-dependent reductase (Old Yellow Enzyme family)